jgi:hypothetical protein
MLLLGCLAIEYKSVRLSNLRDGLSIAIDSRMKYKSRANLSRFDTENSSINFLEFNAFNNIF